MKKYDLAIQDSTKAIELDKDYGKAYQRRAQCYMEIDKWDDALTDLNKAKELLPNDNEILSTIKKAEKQRKVASRKDYYKILGISKNADENEIKKKHIKSNVQFIIQIDGKMKKKKEIMKQFLKMLVKQMMF